MQSINYVLVIVPRKVDSMDDAIYFVCTLCSSKHLANFND